MSYRMSEIVRLTGDRLVGDPDLEIRGVASSEDASEGDLTLAVDRRHLQAAHSRRASAIIIDEVLSSDLDSTRSYLISSRPKLSFAKALQLFEEAHWAHDGISPQAYISPSAVLGAGVKVGPFAVVGPEASIGDNTTIHAGCYIGSKVIIGADCCLFPNVVVMDRCMIGSRVRIHPGTVIGADGFGYIFDGSHQVKIPQIGIVEIGDDVEIGANSCVDRATTGKTIIGEGTKIDNLVQVGHNVRVGRSAILVGQSGIGGSSVIGDLAIIAGQAGVSDHTHIGDRAVVLAQSVASGRIRDGETVSGVPACNHRDELRTKLALRKLPELMEQLRSAERARTLERGRTPNNGGAMPDEIKEE